MQCFYHFEKQVGKYRNEKVALLTTELLSNRLLVIINQHIDGLVQDCSISSALAVEDTTVLL